MKNYFVSCHPAIKRFYQKNYWYNDCKPDKIVSCETPKEALKEYVDSVLRSEFDISKTALSRPKKKFLDLPDGTPARVGYVLTGYTEIEGKMVPFDLWIEIHEVIYPEKGW